jgi:capsular polysaccharide biosynthesis protein
MQSSPAPIPRKLVEAAFRRFWFLVLPVLAAPAIVFLVVEHEITYESTATAWVSEASGLGSSPLTGRPSSSQDKTVAQRQVEVVADLLATRSFREAVATRAGLLADDTTPAARAAIVGDLRERLAVVAAGPNLVTVTASGDDADMAQRLAAAFVAVYQERAATESAREAATILAYFETQVADAEADLAETSAAIAAYVATHPGVLAAPDAEYQRLLALSAVQESLLARVLQSQKDAQLSAASISAMAESLFVVQDMPERPSAPVPVPLMTRAAYPAAAAFLGLFISAAFLWVAYRSDRTIRTAADVEALDVAVLGAVPELKPDDVARRFTPLRWAGFLRRNYARRVAASISPTPEREQVA